MNDVKKEYTTALFKLAQEEHCTETVLADLRGFAQLCKDTPGYIRLMSAPNIKREERCRMLDEAFRDRMHPYTLNFLKIMVERGYFSMLPACCELFVALYHQANGIEVVKVTTVAPLSAEQKTRLIENLRRRLNKQIELQEAIDPALIGGVRLEMQGTLVDASVKARLDSIRDMLNSTVL